MSAAAVRALHTVYTEYAPTPGLAGWLPRLERRVACRLGLQTGCTGETGVGSWAKPYSGSSSKQEQVDQ